MNNLQSVNKIQFEPGHIGIVGEFSSIFWSQTNIQVQVLLENQ